MPKFPECDKCGGNLNRCKCGSPSVPSAEATSKPAGPVSSLSCGAIVSCGPAKRKSGEPVKCPVCHYYTRIYGACYVCGSITGRRKKESTTERQPTANKADMPPRNP